MVWLGLAPGVAHLLRFVFGVGLAEPGEVLIVLLLADGLQHFLIRLGPAQLI